MRKRAFASSKRFAASLCASTAVLFGGAMASVSAAPSLSPTLISVSAGSTRAVALESVTMRAEPFSLSSAANFSANDPRTRITLFVMNLDLLAGETQTSLTADAEDAAHAHYPLKVEYVGQVPGFQGIYMVVMRLNDLMTGNLGDVLVRLNLHGMGSNRVRVAIGQLGGGPADDGCGQPQCGTPAPPTPPTPATPLTLAEYQAQVGAIPAAAGPDGLRFLEQATWGPSDADLSHLQQIGMQAWINEQFNTPPQFVDNSQPPPTPPLFSDYPATPLYPINQPVPCDATCVRDNYTLYPLQRQFMNNALTQPDQLRQRVSFALHKFIVVSGQQLNNNEASWYAPYLQTIDRNAFGSFRQLLFDITLNPGMGQYLDMRGNSVINQANPTPNENYAREIMQLFSIGVDTLNQDGTPVLDAQGNRVSSYDQNTVYNLARVFTGWDLAGNRQTVINGLPTNVTNYLDPMVLSNVNRYDLGQKTLFGVNFPACTTSMPPCTSNAQKQAYKSAELNTAIDLLFNHANTAPYVCTQLIHQMVTSNPSPAYVGRCSAAFANNGSNVRGDMKAIITTILLDPEARGDVKSDPNYGHLREPVLLLTNLLRTFNATSDGVLVTTTGGSLTTGLGQNVFDPPTVFSYFPGDFGLPGTNLFGPEFGILDTSTTYGRANLINTLFLANNGNGIAAALPNRPTGTQFNYASYQTLSTNPPALVDALNARLMHGTMSAAMNATIVATVTAITNATPATQALQRTQTAIYLVATSAQYQVER